MLNPKRLRLLILSCTDKKLIYDLTRFQFTIYKITKEDTTGNICKTIKRGVERAVAICGYPNNIKTRLCQDIPNAAQGIYLYVSLVVADLEHITPTKSDIDKLLKNLPKDIMELYNMILGRISKKEKIFIKMLFIWLVFWAKLLGIKKLRIGLALSRIQRLREIIKKISISDLKKNIIKTI